MPDASIVRRLAINEAKLCINNHAPIYPSSEQKKHFKSIQVFEK